MLPDDYRDPLLIQTGDTPSGVVVRARPQGLPQEFARMPVSQVGESKLPALGVRADASRVSVRDIAADDLDVVFQPIVDLRTGRTFAFEALTRCKWEQFKNPVQLFAQAQAERCCGDLGRKVRDVAFARCGHMPLFINLHPHELEEGWLVKPDDPLFFHEHAVFLEITESAAFTYFALCKSVLKELCARGGAHLVVDDLGAGYSNLKRIVELEPDVVKLDLALVRGIDKSKKLQILVRHVVSLCEALGAQVVSEGIETMDELKAVLDTGARYGQGYLFARPDFPLPKVNWPL